MHRLTYGALIEYNLLGGLNFWATLDISQC